MRLTFHERKMIKKIFLEVFKEGSIYLFGSRVDDRKRGGDIDLYIKLPYSLSAKEKYAKQRDFKLKLYDCIGEQKIDVIISSEKNRHIEKEVLQKGVLL